MAGYVKAKKKKKIIRETKEKREKTSFMKTKD